MIRNMIKDDMDYIQEGNVFHFLTDENSRPGWSKALDEYLTGNQINLMMKRRYSGQKRRMKLNDSLRHFVEFVSASDGVKVDLASGPSGYFAPFLDTLKDNDCFIITDACPSVIKAHADICRQPNCYIFDVDLDKDLPFRNESVDIFTGNLLNNVENYGGLIREAYRCLKPDGKLAVIEMFFDEKHKIIYNVLMALRNKDIAVDITTVSNELEKEKGGLSKLKIGFPISITEPLFFPIKS